MTIGLHGKVVSLTARPRVITAKSTPQLVTIRHQTLMEADVSEILTALSSSSSSIT